MHLRLRSLFIMVLLCTLLLLWVFRLQCLYHLQLLVLKNSSEAAGLSNVRFAQNAFFPAHKIYSLSGVERLFPHRVNTVQRLKYLYGDFKGFECDIDFDESRNAFFTTHGDVVEGNSTIRDFLALDKEKKIFWLDVKNLSDKNVEQFCDQLLLLDREFDIRNRFIIESTDSHMAEIVASKGFFTSFYIFSDPGGNVGSRLSLFCKDSSSRVSTISHDILFTDTLSGNCGERKQLIWDLAFWHSLNKKILLAHANDTSILVCLLNIKSPGYQ